MALFIPVLIGVPIGYYTWATVFDAVDDKISQAISGSPSPSTTTGNRRSCNLSSLSSGTPLTCQQLANGNSFNRRNTTSKETKLSCCRHSGHSGFYWYSRQICFYTTNKTSIVFCQSTGQFKY